MPSILVATGFVRIDADTKPAAKALAVLGAAATAALTSTVVPAAAAAATALLSVASAAAAAGAASAVYAAAVVPQFKAITEASEKQATAEDAKTKSTLATAEAQKLAKKFGFEYGTQVKVTSKMTAEARENAKQYNSALSAAQSASKSSTMAQAAYNEKLAAMTPATRATAVAFQKLKDDQKKWSDSLSSSTMPLFTRGIEFLRSLLPKLTPVVRDVAQELDRFVNSLRMGVAGQVFQQFGQNVKTNGAGALGTFLDVVRNITVGFVGLLNTFMPMSTQVTGGLVQLTQRFAEWGATSQNSPGLQRMIQTAKDAVPSFVSLAHAVGEVTSAAGPLAGIGIKVLTLFAQLIEATPTPVLRAIVPAVIAINIAMKAYAVYTSAAAAVTWLFSTSVTTSTGAVASSRAALLLFRIQQIAATIATTGSTVANWLFYTSVTTSTGAVASSRVALLLFRIQQVAAAVATGALTVATWAATAATYAWGVAVAVATSPITLIIVAIGALVAAIVYIAVKTTWFQTAWKASWDFVKMVALAVGHWFAGPFVDFFVGAYNKINRFVIQPIVWFFTVGLPKAASVLASLTIGAWIGLMNMLIGVYNGIRDRVVKPLITFFTVNIPGGAMNARNRVVGWWNSMRDGLYSGYAWIRDRVFNPLGNFFTKTIPGWASSMNNKVRDFFTLMRDGIGSIWQGIQDKTKAPINWVIDHVWNRGIVSIWKKITGWIGLGNKLGNLKLLAAGGTVGPAQPGMFNRPTAIVGEGNSRYPEYVIPTDPKYATRAKGLWQAAGAHFMEDGGVLGKIGGAISGAVSSVTDFLSDPLSKAKKLLGGPLSKLSSLGSSDWAQMAGKFPRMAVDGLLGLVKNAASGLIGNIAGAVGLGGGGNGGSGVARWGGVVQMALRQVGQPAAYKDITLRRMNQESGGNPTIVNKWDSNWLAGHPSVGLMQVIGPTFRSFAGPYRGTGPFMYGVSVNPLANIYSSMKYALSAYGSLPAAYNRKGGYANGTAGTTAGMHLFGERGPELGFSPAGWRILNARRTAALGGGGLYVDRLVIENHGVLGSQHEVENWLVTSLTELKRKGRVI